jgi:hypothetical protein
MSSRQFVPPVFAALLLLELASAQQPQAKWQVYEQPADGFALALPPGWTALDLNPKTLDRMLEKGVAVNPDLKAMEKGIRHQVAAGIRFLGLEKVRGGPNVSVGKFPLRGEVSLDVAATDVVKQFDALPTVERPIRRKRVRLKAGEAERLNYVLPVKPPGEAAKRLAMMSYLVVSGRELYVITMTAGVEEAATYAPTFERVAQSFRLLGK